MIQALNEEITKIVDPADLIHLAHDDLVYVAKCTAELIHEKRKHNEELVMAVEHGDGFGFVMHEIVENLK